jgi:hypothetical protein
LCASSVVIATSFHGLFDVAVQRFDGHVDQRDGVACLLHQVGQRERLPTGNRLSVLDLGCLVRAGGDVDEDSPNQPFGLRGRDRVVANQLPQVVAHFHLHAELSGRRRRDEDVSHLSGVETRDPHGGADLQLPQLRELRIDGKAILEEHAALANHEERHREQQQPDDDKCARADDS